MDHDVKVPFSYIVFSFVAKYLLLQNIKVKIKNIVVII